MKGRGSGNEASGKMLQGHRQQQDMPLLPRQSSGGRDVKRVPHRQILINRRLPECLQLVARHACRNSA